LAERRLLLVAPTGGGKSLVYQLPALLLPGTTLVVSPLVALMHDQVAALEERGVAATYLAATLEPDELGRRMARLAGGGCRLAYVAPERLAQPGFRALLRTLAVPLVAVDEAHCISEWGHDFRPEYMQIGDVLKGLPEARILACTATATPVVRDEILSRLALPADTPQQVRGFARPNLALRAAPVAGSAERARAVDAALAEALGTPERARGCAIVYAATRRECEAEARRLQGRGWRTAGYHAGHAGSEREQVHHAFLEAGLDVVVATNAFGMGIDRPDVRAVVHLAPPGSVEAYYQEVGRAGRDGKPALGLLLFSNADLPRRRRLLEGDALDAAQRDHRWQLFLELMRLAESGSCRHDAILRYFGDEAETLDGCGRCDNCQALERGGDDGFDDATRTLVVRKALSAVARLHGRFGLGQVTRLLLGRSEPRLERLGLEETATFGALREHDEGWLLAVLRRCVAAGWVDFAGGDRPVVVLTGAGGAVMRAEQPARLRLPPRRGTPPPRRSERRGPAPDEEPLAPEAEGRFEALRRWRRERAQRDGVPPYVVAHDRTLREIARAAPGDAASLAGLPGLGPAKIARYAEEILATLADADAQRSRSVAPTRA